MASGTVPGTFPDLQTAVNQAQFGDVITVKSSYTFAGPLNCGTPGGSTPAYVTIQSDSVASLPAEVPNQPWTGRVNPSHAPFMPKITAGQNSQPAIAFAAGSKWWKFRGIEVLPQSGVEPILMLVSLNVQTGDATQLPTNIAFDQCYIHAFPTSASYQAGMFIRNGIYAICNKLDVTNCYIAEIKGLHQGNVAEAHGVTIDSGSGGPVTFLNNYIEGAGHSILFGGDGAFSSSMPKLGSVTNAQGWGIVLQWNTFTKNLQWNSLSPSYVVPPVGTNPNVTGNGSSIYVIKCLVEFKNGENAFVDHNVFQYNWAGDQTGQGINSNLAAYTATTYETIGNILVSNNVIDSVCVPLEWATNSDPTVHAPGPLGKIQVKNNLCTNMAWKWGGPTVGAEGTARTNCTAFWPFGPYIYDHNTFVSDPSVAQGNANSIIEFDTSNPPDNFNVSLTNNILIEGANGYKLINPGGVSSSNNTAALNQYVTMSSGQNVIYDRGTLPPTIYSGDIPVASQAGVGFTTQNLTLPQQDRNGNPITITAYLLSSTAFGGGTDGTAIGCNIQALTPVATGTTATTTSISSSLNPAPTGQSITLTATVAPQSGSGTPTGGVSFFDGNMQIGSGTLSGGSATLTLSSLSAGTHSITAVYSGDNTFAGSTSAVLSETVNAPASVVTLSQAPQNPIPAGQNVKVAVTVST